MVPLGVAVKDTDGPGSSIFVEDIFTSEQLILISNPGKLFYSKLNQG